MAASARRASPPSSSSSGAASHAPPTYDWEVALENDRRMPKMQQFVNTILHANFSTVQEKLRKEEPPARRHEPAPAPAPALEASGNGHAHLGPKQARMTLQPDPSASPTQLPGYMSESSSEVDMREVDPMDELSDFEPHPHDTPEQQGNGAVERSHAPPNRADDGDDDMNGGANDFEPGEDDNEDDDDEEETTCVVCNSTENEKQILLCDQCNDEYHLYCLSPPLTQVPPGEWFCPRCVPPRQAPQPPAANTTTTQHPSVVKRELSRPNANVSVNPSVQAPAASSTPQPSAPLPAATADVVQVKQERVRQLQQASTQSSRAVQPTVQTQGPSAPNMSNSPSVAHTFESDAAKSNELLIHACQCDELKCSDLVFHEFCPHMKRFLRSACWASHSEKWRAYRIARVTAELFAYHALHCEEPQCSVPMCDQLRAEEFV